MFIFTFLLANAVVVFFRGEVNIADIYPFPGTRRACLHHDRPGLAFI